MRRSVLVLIVFALFCAAYVAPLGMALQAAGSADHCCSKEKGSHCCRRTHRSGWVGTNNPCSQTCPASFTLGPGAVALLVTAHEASVGPTLAGRSIPATTISEKSSFYPAFRYQRPPPVC